MTRKGVNAKELAGGVIPRGTVIITETVMVIRMDRVRELEVRRRRRRHLQGVFIIETAH